MRALLYRELGGSDDLRGSAAVRRPADFGRRMMRGAPEWLAGLGVGVAAGWLCSRIGTPIPWMLGPLVALAALRVSGVPVTAPLFAAVRRRRGGAGRC
jgi:hypothetical protein